MALPVFLAPFSLALEFISLLEHVLEAGWLASCLAGGIGEKCENICRQRRADVPGIPISL
jgi:hypothetical protein